MSDSAAQVLRRIEKLAVERSIRPEAALEQIESLAVGYRLAADEVLPPNELEPIEAPPEILSAQQAAQVIVRERETRHWTNEQRREALGEHWPSETAKITREADAAVDWYMEALAQLRSAWNAHFRDCDAVALDITPPTVEQVNAWLNAPSDTASA